MTHRTDPDVAEDVTLLGTQASVSGGRERRDEVELPRGSSIDRYVILERIGTGGMGIVYAALDPDLGRKVAIKLVRGEVVDESRTVGSRTTGAARLLREAQAMARVHHANVITVYDVGTVDGAVFIAMEYLDGGTLRAWLETPRPWTEVVRRFRAAGAGLVAAHAAGLVHRDFKPDNVLLGSAPQGSDEIGRVCVVDFGISRSSNELAPPTSEASVSNLDLDELRLTRTGALVGTPAYMAPEQHTGGVADAKSDQFALAVALYEGLYRQRPFEGGNATQLAANVIEGCVRAPPAETQTPSWLWPIVARGLAVDPNARHPDVATLLAALADDPAVRRRRQLRRIGIAALAAPAIAGAAAFVRSPAAVCTGAEDTFAEVWNDEARKRGHDAFAGSGRAHATHAWTETEQVLDAYASAWIDAHTTACRATAVLGEQSQDLLDRRIVCLERRRSEVESVVAILADADRTVVDNAARVVGQISAIDACGDTAALLGESAVAPADLAETEDIRAQLDRAKILRTAIRIDQAGTIVDDLEDRVRALDHQPTLARWLHVRASVDIDRGRIAQAEADLYQAATVAAVAGETGLEPAIWLALVRIVGTFADRPLELPPIVKAAEVAVARAGSLPADRGALGVVVGLQAVQRSEFIVGEARLREAVQLLGAVQGLEHPDVLEARELLALTLHGQQRYDEAEAMLTEVADAIERTLQPTHPRLGTVVGNLARVHAARGDLEAARAAHERAIKALEAGFGADHQVLGTAHANLATTLRKLGRYDEALQHLDRTRAIEVAAFGAESPRIADNHHGRAQIAMKQGRPERALADYREALRIWEKTLGANDVRLAYALVGIGKAQLAAHVEAGVGVDVAGLERALALREGSKNVAADDLAEARFVLARALRAAGREPARAVTLANEARTAFATAGAQDDVRDIDAWLAAR